MEHSIERAVKHYSSLFTLPSYTSIVALSLLLCLAGSEFTLFIVAGAPIILSFQFGVFLFTLSALSDIAVRRAFLSSDLIYTLRRCAALSMFSLLLWFFFLLVGSLLARFLSWSLWVALFSIGFAAVCILRLIVLVSTSSASCSRVAGAALTQPILCLFSMFYVASSMGYMVRIDWLVGFFPMAVLVSILTASAFISFINRLGLEALQVPSTVILRAFLVNWMENLTAPIEALLERFGTEKSIDFSLLAFKSEDDIKSIVVVPSFHPGPFRNVGSSQLPHIIQETLETRFGCVVAVPHGLFGHEFDLSSQAQNQKVLQGILDSAKFTSFASGASGFVKVQKGVAGATCQIFGDCALLTLTLAPETTEDFPREVGDFIVHEAGNLGLAHVVVVNAHNSIDSTFDVNSALESLKEAATEALKRALGEQQRAFQLGTAKIVPARFSVEDGMGPGGICVLAFRVGEQISIYVTIDGNNMVSGLRDRILGSLGELGVDDGEVLTTDTHEVNAIVVTARGYRPLGEAISHEELIGFVKTAAAEALGNMKPASVAWRAGLVSHVKVIGERQIQELPLLADRTVSRAKKTAVPLFSATGLVLIALLLVAL
jgi:putative membrane protein